MKTSNQNDNRFTKDVLLRQIFQEISDEHEANSPSTPVDDLISTPDPKPAKKGAFLRWIFIIIFLIGIAYVWFYTITEVTDQKKSTTISEQIVSKTDQNIQKKEESKPQAALKEEDENHHVIDITEVIQTEDEVPPTIEDTRSERERAKEALLLQMQN